MGICSSPGSLVDWNALSYIFTFLNGWGICTFGSRLLLLCLKVSLDPRKRQLNPFQAASDVRSDCVAVVTVVTVVWPEAGSAPGPVEWLKALNAEYGLYQPCCLCQKQDLIFLWT